MFVLTSSSFIDHRDRETTLYYYAPLLPPGIFPLNKYNEYESIPYAQWNTTVWKTFSQGSGNVDAEIRPWEW